MKTEELYLSIINNLQDGVYFVDNNRVIQFWNKAAEEISGYTAEDIVGKACPETMLNHIDEEGRPLCIVGCPLYSTLVDGIQRKSRVLLRHKQGHRIPILVNIFPLEQNGKVIGAIEIFTRNSPKIYEDDMVEQLSGIAMHDTLTQLPNRRYLESFLEYKFNEYKRFDRSFAVLFADIDNFGRFNNEYGHEVGDAVLVNIAASLLRSIRHSDLAGRWGGEEFLGIYTIEKPEEVFHVGERFRQLVGNTEVIHNGLRLKVSVSVGVTMVRPQDSPQSLVERGDHLMYSSKKNGKDRVSTDEILSKTGGSEIPEELLGS